MMAVVGVGVRWFWGLGWRCCRLWVDGRNPGRAAGVGWAQAREIELKE